MVILKDGSICPFYGKVYKSHPLHGIYLQRPIKGADPEQLMDFATIVGLCYAASGTPNKAYGLMEAVMRSYVTRWEPNLKLPPDAEGELYV